MGHYRTLPTKPVVAARTTRYAEQTARNAGVEGTTDLRTLFHLILRFLPVPRLPLATTECDIFAEVHTKSHWILQQWYPQHQFLPRNFILNQKNLMIKRQRLNRWTRSMVGNMMFHLFLSSMKRRSRLGSVFLRYGVPTLRFMYEKENNGLFCLQT